MKLSTYFQVVNPEYVYYKLTPHNSIRNYDSSRIAKAIVSLYTNIMQRIRKVEKTYIINKPSKVTYYIYVEKDRVEFYFIIPKLHQNLIKEKITDTWKNITISEVEQLPELIEYQAHYLTYKKEDALSLATDKRTNTLLSSTLNVSNVMQDGDKIAILYNFIPCDTFTWRSDYDRTFDKINDNYPIDREKLNTWYIFKYGAVVLAEFISSIFNAIGGVLSDEKDIDTKKAIMQPYKMIPNQSTIKKRDSSILQTQILVLSESKDKYRMNSNAMAVCEGFKSISEDNELVYKKANYIGKMTDFSLINDSIKMSVDECQNLISLPGRELLNEIKGIENINVTESEVPQELQSGVMCIGENTYKGNTQKAYLSNDKEYKFLTLCIIGPTRAGKTTLISNLSRDAINSGECTIIFDYCGNCELSADVSRVIDKTLTIDCSNFQTMQGLGYNELDCNSNDVFEVYRSAKSKTIQLMTLINSINENDTDLKARMERYLEAAAVITFISNGSIKDVFNVLQSHVSRHRYINLIPGNQIENTDDYVNALLELDECAKGTTEPCGTKMTYIQGILNRLNRLKQNSYMELMLKRDCRNNIDLSSEMQKAQLICIKMPEMMFNTEQEKDIYATYWITKIWGALQKRKWFYQNFDDRIKTNIIIDELYQVPQCQLFLKSKLSQLAKFGCKPIISCHYLGQMPIIRNELKSANSSYMLLHGCDKDNFKELKEELAPYEIEDLLNLKRYHSLNLLKCQNGWAKFITKLPKPISN